MVHLDSLEEKFGPKGFKVLAITAASKSSIDDFVEKTKAKHAIVIVEQGTLADMGVKSYPSGFLLGPDGRILWTGHPGNLPDDSIASRLENFRCCPEEVPAKLSPIRKAIDKQKFSDALAKAVGALNGTGLTDEERPVAESLRDWIQWLAQSGLDGAAKDLEGGRVYQAWLGYDRVASLFKGTEFAQKASSEIASLLSDKDRKREVDAGKKLDKAREQARDMDKDKAVKLYESLAKKFEGTKAAARAAELALEIGKD